MLPADPELPVTMPLPSGPWLYSRRVVDALTAAASMHGAQRRKGSDVPYIAHLLGTCAIALEYGADEDEAIGALLHDAIEDVQPTDAARATVASFGERVLAIVVGCTDADTHPKPPWRERKQHYIDHLREADGSVLLVSAADKLHNARSLVADLRREGPSVWDRFKASREETLWSYRAAMEAMRANPAHRPELVDELERVVMELASFVDESWPVPMPHAQAQPDDRNLIVGKWDQARNVAADAQAGAFDDFGDE
jgi:GTP pyrophosphokinase